MVLFYYTVATDDEVSDQFVTRVSRVFRPIFGISIPYNTFYLACVQHHPALTLLVLVLLLPLVLGTHNGLLSYRR